MSERIRQLEDALAILHRMISNNPAKIHPLLKEELMNIKNGIEEAVPEQEQETAEEEIIEAFGSLTIERNGVSSFHGFSGGLEVNCPDYLLPMIAQNATPLRLYSVNITRGRVILLSKTAPRQIRVTGNKT